MKFAFPMKMSLCLVLLFLAACGQGAAIPPTPTQSITAKKTYKNLVVGFAQVGALSAWVLW